MNCHNFLKLICKKDVVIFPPKIIGTDKCTKLFKHPGYLFALFKKSKRPIVLLVSTGEKNTFKIVYDGRFIHNKWPLFFYFLKNGKPMKKPKRSNLIIKSTPVSDNFCQFSHFKEIINHYDNNDINFLWVISPSKPFYGHFLKLNNSNPNTRVCHIFYNDKEKLDFKIYHPSSSLSITSPLLKQNNEFKARNNRQASMHFKHTGLNLALQLGIINFEEFYALSKMLAKMCGFLTFGTDTITFQDYDTNIKCLIPREWNILFEIIDARAKICNSIKEKCLSFVLARLDSYPQNINSLFSSCKKSILRVILKFKIFILDPTHLKMHTLKLPMGTFYKSKNPKCACSIFLKCSKNNDILSLLYKHITITNFAPVLGIISNTSFKNAPQLLRNVCKNWQTSNLTLFDLYQTVNLHFLNEFRLDISMLEFTAIANLSNLIFWQLYLINCNENWLIHPVEKTLASNQEKIRQFSKGGYSFSAGCQLNVGEYKSIYNLDIVASYGYAGSRMHAAGGFGSTFEQGRRLETSQRFKFFEFRAVFYTIYKWQILEGRKILALYHNYSPLGIFSIGNYPIDLVGIFANEPMEIIQFDSAFCHGCTCCNLSNYCDGKSRAELNETTHKRNCFILDWISKCNNASINFKAITDCCSGPTYLKINLDKCFQTISDLKQLIRGYSSIINDNLENVHPEITFIAIVVFDKIPINSIISTNEQEQTLLTKDYYNFLKLLFPTLRIIKIDWVVFYKIDYTFNMVYKTLLKYRKNSTSFLKQFYKNIINLSCGYFGSNPSKNKNRFVRLTNNLPKNFDSHNLIPIEGPNPYEFHVVKTKLNFKNNFRSAFSLINFCMIIEYGKMRLDEIFNFYTNNLINGSWKLLYANTDSTIVALTTTSIKEALITNADLKTYFDENEAGKLKTVWHYLPQDDWSFITCRKSSYSIKTNHSCLSKMSNILPTINPQKIFNIQKQLLNKKHCTLLQHRRKNKLAGIVIKNKKLKLKLQ